MIIPKRCPETGPAEPCVSLVHAAAWNALPSSVTVTLTAFKRHLVVHGV